MALIESKKVVLKADQQAVYSFVKDLNNLIELLPQDKVSDWKGGDTNCSFKVSGGYSLGLEHKSLSEFNQIILQSSAGSPLKFDLDIQINPSEAGSEAGMVCNLEANAFVMMMVEKPLRNLFDFIAERLHQKFG
ncbi:MAG: hypothetical protein NWR73_10870 [Flavobacteriales bacterium]|jgi:carbon monoxide dehydrogenase subunit G|nr:hypothetical protein [Flavobacteriales bacterium]